MAPLSTVTAIVMATDIGGGKAIIECKAPKSTMTLELEEGSGWTRVLTEGAIIKYTIEVVQQGAPAPDQITATATLESAGKEPSGLILLSNDEKEIDHDAEPTGAEITQLLASTKRFDTPPADIPPPTLSPEHPSVATKGVPVRPLADVKDLLGI